MQTQIDTRIYIGIGDRVYFRHNGLRRGPKKCLECRLNWLVSAYWTEIGVVCLGLRDLRHFLVFYFSNHRSIEKIEKMCGKTLQRRLVFLFRLLSIVWLIE